MNKLSADIEIRCPKADECTLVRDLVQTVVDEIYGGLWADPPLPLGDQDWSLAWVAVVEEQSPASCSPKTSGSTTSGCTGAIEALASDAACWKGQNSKLLHGAT